MNIKILAFYCLCLVISNSTFAQIVNEGTLKISPSTSVYFENAYVNQSTGIHVNDVDLYFNDNFVNNGVASSASGTTYFKSLANDVLNISGTRDSIQFYNLEVDVYGASKKGVYVADNIGVVVTKNLNLVNGDLRLAGNSQLVQKQIGANTNTVISGSLLKDQQGTSNGYAYNYMSSPTTNNTGTFSLYGGLYDGTDAGLSPFSPQQILFNSGSPYNGASSVLNGSGNVVTPLTVNTRWLYMFPQNSNSYYGWKQITSSTAINPGYGFSIKGSGVVGQNYVFKGVPNNGDITFPILSGQSALFGNPYPSAIDANKLIADNLSVFDNIQFWVDGGSTSHYLADYQGGYAVYNLTGGVAPSLISTISGLGTSSGVIPKRYIAVAQGFFIDAISNGNVVFSNSQRVFKTEDGVISSFYKTTGQKNEKVADTDKKYIRIGYNSPEGYHRQLLLGFLPGTTADLGVNLGYDAIPSTTRDNDLFFIIDNDFSKKYIIQGVGSYDASYKFPLSLIIKESGIHTIMLDAVENFPDPVYIKDNVLNKTYNLKDASLELSLPSGVYNGRFELVFIPEHALSIKSSIEENIQVYYKDNTIVVNNKKLLRLNNVLVYNMLGQYVVELKNEVLNKEQIEIPLQHSQGVYLVVVHSNEGSKTFKIAN
ncbi:T9SS type A sorting domain-containing protein [Mariniflexile sp.]|uniref:T9SS type A sorting domain-containing protein n=1 Tax=Mariniflexile sp. TaxID=1979402 RepID=UPI003562AB32